jgi:hypothetical protein
MVNRLSLAKATGKLTTLHATPIWQMYLRGREAQAAIEAELVKTLIAEGSGRERVLAHWMQSMTD